MFRGKRIMVVVAHPDDELLGLGATMNKLIKEQNVITHVVILGEGITSRSDTRDVKLWEKELSVHRSNIVKAQKKIGYHSVSTYGFSDNRFDSHALLDIIKVIEKEKEQFNPDVIFTHNGSDLNVDHRRCFEAVMTATRPVSGECVRTIITFETPSCTEWQATSYCDKFSPNLMIAVDIAHLNIKQEAMECYEMERRVFPHPRSREALEIMARNRGMQIGVNYAEAFQLIRSIL